MSYDVWLEIDTGGNEPATVAECGNYTSNVSPMFYAALGSDGLRGLDRIGAAHVIARLTKAVADMADPKRRQFYRDMNPKNGWGNHVGATKYLEGILEACRAHPLAVVRVCA